MQETIRSANATAPRVNHHPIRFDPIPECLAALIHSLYVFRLCRGICNYFVIPMRSQRLTAVHKPLIT